MIIIDTHNLLSHAQNAMLQAEARKNFVFGGFSSLDGILTNLNVPVIIEPGVQKRKTPVFFDDLEKYWTDKRNEEELKIIPGDNDSRRGYDDASAKLKDIWKNKKCWEDMPLRGYYDPVKIEIVLFPEEMKTEYNGKRVDELLISTLAHETMHAYFDRPRHKHFLYVPQIEEPLAEFGMLVYIRRVCPGIYDWAYNDVNSKNTFYKYGAQLMDEYSSGDISLYNYLVAYKLLLSNNVYLTIPGLGRRIGLPVPTAKTGVRRLYTINGSGEYRMYEVVEEYIKYRLDKGDKFVHIKNDIENVWKAGNGFVDMHLTGVKLGSNGGKPYSFEYKGNVFFVTKELMDLKDTHNFHKFRVAVYVNDNDFQIAEIKGKNRTNSKFSVVVNGVTVSGEWKKVFDKSPRSYYDVNNNLLFLDGEWDFDMIMHHVWYNKINRVIRMHSSFDVYLGDNCAINHPWELFSHYCINNCHVSPNNKIFKLVRGVIVYKKDNEPALKWCGKGLYKLYRNGKYGVVDKNINQIVPCKYNCIWDIDSNGLFMVRENMTQGHRYGLVNMQGQEQVPVVYDDISRNNDGTYKVKQGGNEFEIDVFGNKI